MEDSIIYQIFKWEIEGIKSFIGMIFISYWFNSADMNCNKDSKSYHYAHSISQNRLEKMHLDLRKYIQNGEEIDRITKRDPKRPMEFEDINYTRIILQKHEIENVSAIIRLNFCMDQSIDLEVENIMSDEARIYLAWGEIERTKELLWRKNETSNNTLKDSNTF